MPLSRDAQKHISAGPLTDIDVSDDQPLLGQFFTGFFEATASANGIAPGNGILTRQRKEGGK